MLLGAVACLGVACAGPSTRAAPIPPTTTSAWRVPSGHVAQVVLTPDGTDRYSVAADGAGSLVVSAPATNEGGNLRALAWQPDRPATVDQQACVTWPSVIDLSKTGLDGLAGNTRFWQPGIALRIATNGTVTKAISIAQNVWAGAMWIFWVQMWDTGNDDKMQATTVKFDALRSAGHLCSRRARRFAAPPWHVCARVVGARLDFKLWTGRSPEPTYADPKHAFHARLPADWVYAGFPGATQATSSPASACGSRTSRRRPPEADQSMRSCQRRLAAAAPRRNTKPNPTNQPLMSLRTVR